MKSAGVASQALVPWLVLSHSAMNAESREEEGTLP